MLYICTNGENGNRLTRSLRGDSQVVAQHTVDAIDEETNEHEAGGDEERFPILLVEAREHFLVSVDEFLDLHQLGLHFYPLVLREVRVIQHVLQRSNPQGQTCDAVIYGLDLRGKMNECRFNFYLFLWRDERLPG